MVLLEINSSIKKMSFLLVTTLYFALFFISDSFILQSEAYILKTACILSIFLHEIIHAITGLILGIPAKKISITIILEKGLANCTFAFPIKRLNMIKILLSPSVFLSLLAFLLFLFTGYIFWFFFIILVLLTGLMDIIMVINVLFMPKDSIIYEPSSNISGIIMKSSIEEEKNNNFKSFLLPSRKIPNTDILDSPNKTKISIFSLIIFFIAGIDVLDYLISLKN